MNVLLETERLTITEMTMDMAEAVHENSLDEDTRKFVPDEVFETLEDAKETIGFLMSRYETKEGPLVYALITKEENRNIGYVQLVPIDDGKWEVGYHIAKPFTCRGYATEAVSAFLPVMSEKLGISEVYGIRLSENKASGRVLEKCGFQSFFTGMGPYHDGVFEIDKSVWRKTGMGDFGINEMLEMQRALQDKYKDKWEGISPEIGKNKLLWMVGEVGEVIDVVKKNGDLKACDPNGERAHLVEELADVLMHYNDVLLCYGITADELKAAYTEKFEKNMKRW